MTPGTLTIRSRDFPTFNRFAVGFDQLFDDLQRISNQQENYPPYNIVKVSEEQTLIELAVAGFKQGDISITLDGRLLTITGEQAQEVSETPTEYLHRGISARNFTRSFTLGDFIEINNADVKDGILTITLERKIPEDKKPKTIAITYN